MGLQAAAPVCPHPPPWAPAHPLLVELQQLLRHLGSVESQPQAVDVELGDDIFQGVLQGQAPPCPMLHSCGCGVLQDGATQGGELLEEEEGRLGGSQDSGRDESTCGCPVLKATCGMVSSLGSARKH